MEWLALILLAAACLAGFAAIFFTSVGTLIIFLAAVTYGLATGLDRLTLAALLWVAGLYLLGEALEYAAALLAARRFGASPAAAWGALLGGLLGAAAGVALAGVGLFFGMLLGIFLGAFAVELAAGRGLRRAVRSGAAGLAGRAAAIGAKVLVALAMFAVMGASLWRSTGH